MSVAAKLVNRRPYLSKYVVAGLEDLLRRTQPTNAEEASAIVWIVSMIEWRRLQSAQPNPQDAEVCLLGKSEESSCDGSSGDGDETETL